MKGPKLVLESPYTKEEVNDHRSGKDKIMEQAAKATCFDSNFYYNNQPKSRKQINNNIYFRRVQSQLKVNRNFKHTRQRYKRNAVVIMNQQESIFRGQMQFHQETMNKRRSI